MLAVEKWAQGKNPLIAMFAPQAVAFAREIPDIVKCRKTHRFFSHTYQVPDLVAWNALYRNHRQYFSPFLDMIYEASPFAQKMIEMGTAVNAFARNPGLLQGLTITPAELKEGQDYINEMLRMSFAELQVDFDDVPLSPEVRSTVQKYKEGHEMELMFLFLVAFPCWFFYKEWPSALYYRAIRKNGDTNAIHKLLRLDPFVLHDPAIGKRIQNVRINGKLSHFEELLNAPLKPLKVKLTSRTMKDMLAGFISLFAETLKQPLTSTEIRDLFDAVAQDADKQDIDTTLPESQEGYLKVIQRNRHEWQSLMRPGQKKMK